MERFGYWAAGISHSAANLSVHAAKVSEAMTVISNSTTGIGKARNDANVAIL